MTGAVTDGSEDSSEQVPPPPPPPGPPPLPPQLPEVHSQPFEPGNGAPGGDPIGPGGSGAGHRFCGGIVGTLEWATVTWREEAMTSKVVNPAMTQLEMPGRRTACPRSPPASLLVMVFITFKNRGPS